MKNFNWGHGIALFYVLFVGALLTALISSFGVDHALVVEDYYNQDLNYQKQYEKMENTQTLNNANIKYDISTQELKIEFLNGVPAMANVLFYRPSDSSKDFKLDLGEQFNIMSTSSMVKGKWVIKLDWKEGDKNYYLEKDVIL
jgi:nitrogen fixation protein FixH